jgi:cytochrome P450
MVQARWRLARIRRLEVAVIARMLGSEEGDLDGMLAAALLGKTAGPWLLLQRQAAATERCYFRAHKQLMDARKSGPQLDLAGLLLQNEPNSADWELPMPQSKPDGAAPPHLDKAAIRPRRGRNGPPVHPDI